MHRRHPPPCPRDPHPPRPLQVHEPRHELVVAAAAADAAGGERQGPHLLQGAELHHQGADDTDVTLPATVDAADVCDMTLLATTDDLAGHPAEVQQPGGPAVQGEAAARGESSHEATRHQGNGGDSCHWHRALGTPGYILGEALVVNLTLFT